MEDAIKLQEDLDKLQEWEKDWLMTFYPKKCQVLHVTSKRNPVRKDYTIHGEPLEETESAKYLGVNLHMSLSSNNHRDAVAMKPT